MYDPFEQENIKKYFDELMLQSKENILKIDPKDPIMLKNIELTLQGKGFSERVQGSKILTAWEKFLSDIFFSFTEILHSLENIQMISVFVKQFPSYKKFEKYKITPAKFLRYHVENYLNEVYIYEQRTKYLLAKIEKKVRKYNLDSKKIKILRDMITTATRSVISLRGHHIHVKRFNDDKLDRLSFLEVVSEKEQQQIINRIIYRSDRSKYSQEIMKTHLTLTEILDIICKVTYDICFSDIKSAMR